MKKSESPTPLSGFSIVRSALMAFVVVVLLYALSVIAEHLWLQNISMNALHMVHLVRGLAASLITAILVGWMIVRASHPLLPKEEWIMGNRDMQNQWIENFNRWFIFMRWMAVMIASILVIVVVRLNNWLPQKVFVPLLLIIGLLAALNATYLYILRFDHLKQYLLPFQTYADLVILTAMLQFSGGIENPLTLLLMIHVIIAGIVLSQKQLYSVTATAIGLLLVMAIGEAVDILPHYTLNIFPHHFGQGSHLIHAAHQPLFVISFVGMMVTILLLTAYFISTIMNRIRYDESQLEKMADQALEQSQLIEKALENTDTGLCVCDNNGKPYWINPIWNAWFGKVSINRLIPAKGLAESERLSSTLKDGKTNIREIKLNGKNGDEKERVYQIMTAPLLDKDGNIDRAVSLAKDITDQKEAQDQMMRAGKLAAVGELAGKVAHEVNNPIAILSAKCRLLLSDHSDEMSDKVSEELVKITDAADRVAKIAQGLLSYCRPSPATRSEIDVSNPIRNALSLIDRSAARTGIKIINRLPDHLQPIMANADEMQQVFMNLFINALDAMPNGGELIVAVNEPVGTPNGVSGFISIEVSDTGTGIPENIQQKIFEPFFTTKSEGKGTGLGLSICSGLIRSHEGTIEIDSKPGKGTRFIIRFPVYDKKKESYLHG